MTDAIQLIKKHLPDEYQGVAVAMMKSIMPTNAKPEDMLAFFWHCHQAGLSPWKKQIYASLIQGRLVTMMSIDGYRAIARQSDPGYGLVVEYWHNDDKHWLDYPPLEHGKYALMVRATVNRTNGSPITKSVLYDEFVARDTKGEITSFWRRMPNHMLAKTAESHVLRMAFPAELSGTYTSDEMVGSGLDSLPVVDAHVEVQERQPVERPVRRQQRQIQGNSPQQAAQQAAERVAELMAQAQALLTPVGVEAFRRQLISKFGLPPQVPAKYQESLLKKLQQEDLQKNWNAGRDSKDTQQLVGPEEIESLTETVDGGIDIGMEDEVAAIDADEELASAIDADKQLAMEAQSNV